MWILRAKRLINEIIFSFKPVYDKPSNSTDGDPNRELNAYRLVNIVLFVVFIVNLLLVLTVGYIINEERIIPELNLIEEISVPCEALSLSADEDFETFDSKKGDIKTSVDSKGKYICTEKNFTKIIKTVVERKCRLILSKGNEHRYLSCGNESLRETSGYQTAYFTEISKHPKITGNQTSDDKLYWDNNPKSCYIHKSIDYNNGVITIPEGRDYYVYASVHFNITQKTYNDYKGSIRLQSYTIRLCKNISGYEQTLLRRSELFNVTKSGIVVGSLRVETLLHLTRNDKIYVRVNDASRLIHKTRGNTFGIFPL